jgi:hypothetical protein
MTKKIEFEMVAGKCSDEDGEMVATKLREEQKFCLSPGQRYRVTFERTTRWAPENMSWNGDTLETQPGHDLYDRPRSFRVGYSGLISSSSHQTQMHVVALDVIRAFVLAGLLPGLVERRARWDGMKWSVG